jgi:threonine dehydrogenase-like Zn-dependent dehydrogenase
MSDKTIYDALAEAQAELSNPPKRSKNPHFKSRFADLPTCLDTIRPVLASHGIALVQSPSWESGTLSVTTRLLRGSEAIESTLSCSSAGDPQKIGSAITYLRRYGLCAMVGVAGDDDDDGEQASAPPRRQPAPLPPAEEVRRALHTIGARDRRTADAICRAVTDQGDGSCSVTSVAQATSDDTTAEIVLDGLRAALADLKADGLLKAAEQYMDKE